MKTIGALILFLGSFGASLGCGGGSPSPAATTTTHTQTETRGANGNVHVSQVDETRTEQQDGTEQVQRTETTQQVIPPIDGGQNR